MFYKIFARKQQLDPTNWCLNKIRENKYTAKTPNACRSLKHVQEMCIVISDTCRTGQTIFLTWYNYPKDEDRGQGKSYVHIYRKVISSQKLAQYRYDLCQNMIQTCLHISYSLNIIFLPKKVSIFTVIKIVLQRNSRSN